MVKDRGLQMHISGPLPTAFYESELNLGLCQNRPHIIIASSFLMI